MIRKDYYLMYIYDKVIRFNQITGEPEEKRTIKEIRCDYTGKLIDEYENLYCRYYLNYKDSDPCYGSSGDEYDFGQEFDVYMFEFLCGDYHFSVISGSDNVNDYAETTMMLEALNKINDPKSKWYKCFTFDAICRQSRVQTARLLIKEGEIKPEQLNS